MPAPESARAAVLYGPGDLRIEDRALRPLGPDDVLVTVDAVGVCGSDMHYFAQGRNGQNVLRQPTVLGHEAAGVITAKGSAVPLAVGTRVAVEPAVGCGTCPTCRSGRYNLCPVGTCFGSPPTDGTFAEHIVAAGRAVHPLPDAIPLEAGALIEPLAVAVWAVQRAGVEFGDRVLVTGAGPIGVLVMQVARAAGATEVIVTDVNDARLAQALALGASAVINTAGQAPDLTGIDRLLECSAHPAALWQGLRTLRPAGRAIVVGQAPPSVDGLPLAHLQRWEIELSTAFRSAHAFPTAIALAAEGRVDLAGVLTGRFPLDLAADALRAPGADPAHLKVVVRPGDAPA
ncbi:NAD(P)-dependent alcohol dehydrogenase [Streptomyces scopuliridis]|uniref:NAD(P)-dependent alcohol dehydrogenase n=1 Tax=Streptomyces scopuliridis TaxID=452529 RepID=A0ACD4ZTI6_9ACTN|nr:NAD(P)-dependent alcohol dehydrogenase [Streptomyces scopuliridis]WSB37080.1 NAD(P)-dependent alcohol dehydrogenase [Streptomyces scopuliridis]WSC01476.1 NAD(P)-dependent alcohol dehydrogenase [Streptomyces scopuliridis]WSC04987.1 NAD(P)-dependent alcohol dehydrogenase [Streptomyces scopuliridis]